MRIVLETLFEKIKELNELHELLGCEKLYGIKFVGSGYESNYDSFKETYDNLENLKKNLEAETYLENIDNAIVETMETARNLDDIEFEVTFNIKLPGKERDKQTVYAYLSEL